MVEATKKIAFIGGDERMLFAAEMFAKNGFEAAVYGFGPAAELYGKAENKSTAASALAGAEYAVLPPVVSRDGENIFAPLASEKLPLKEIDFGKTTVFCGAFCPLIEAKTRSYTADESFAVRNALPTAESALKIAMEETRQTICGMRACVLGFGRIAKLLSKNLLALGACVDVFARRSEARAIAEVMGAHAYDFGELGAKIASYDCIFNTVPQNIIGERELEKIKRGAPLIELASAPGGADAAEAKKAGVRLIPAGGLPGKIMPKTAGKIIYETIKEMMDEEENT